MKHANPHIRPVAPARHRQRGIVLIIALAMLLMLTLLSVGMFRSLGLEERITGNTREKQHAFYAAQSALQYAEFWLTTGTAGQGLQCSLTSTSPVPQVCAPAYLPAAATWQQTLATTIWNNTFGTTYVPPQVTINGTPTAQITANQYFENPQYFISYLGSDPNPTYGGNYLYQVSSLGYGGNANAVAVVQSVFSVGSATTCKSDC